MGASIVFGCGDSEPDLHGPSWTELEPIVLRDTGSLSVGAISGFAVLGDSSFVVSDRQAGSLAVYGGSGVRTGTYGRRGAGPGEWRFGPSLVVPLSTETVAVGDGPSTAILTTADFTELARLQKPSPAAQPIGELNGALVFGFIDRERGTAFVAQSPLEASDLAFGHVPEFARASEILSSYFSHAALKTFGSDSVATAFQSSNFLYLQSLSGGAVDSVPIPPITRRGALEDEMRLVAGGRADIAESLLYRPSYPQLIIRVAPDVWGIVFADLTQESGRMTGQLHLALVSHDGSSCGEYALPVRPDPLPFVSAVGATLYAISYVDHEGDAVPLVQRFVINDSSCGRPRTR